MPDHSPELSWSHAPNPPVPGRLWGGLLATKPRGVKCARQTSTATLPAHLPWPLNADRRREPPGAEGPLNEYKEGTWFEARSPNRRLRPFVQKNPLPRGRGLFTTISELAQAAHTFTRSPRRVRQAGDDLKVKSSRATISRRRLVGVESGVVRAREAAHPEVPRTGRSQIEGDRRSAPEAWRPLARGRAEAEPVRPEACRSPPPRSRPRHRPPRKEVGPEGSAGRGRPPAESPPPGAPPRGPFSREASGPREPPPTQIEPAFS